ncbi:unnamed protein product [Periconia digitata]|uniref:Tat pathway signal sequence n=1 Tax=Periconia digitata TaxID=1303443 RepID=A0A9W4XU27_9PLEO|nr:unnamed protein product [Periconia digitata]
MEHRIERASLDIPDNASTSHHFSTESLRNDGTDDVEKFHLLGDGDKRSEKGSWWNPWSTKVLTIVTILNLSLFCTSIFVFSASRSSKQPSDQDSWRATSYYSPVFDRFKIPKLTKVTNGTFWDTDPPSIWRVRKGPEADKAWKAIGSNIAPIIISSSDVVKLGKDPKTAVKAPPEMNLGSDAFIAGMDVFHHLHCLDKLRREISYTHYHEADEGPRPGSELHEAHIDHCLDILSQALRCTGSVDMVTFNWVEGHRMPQPDFSNNKVCRNFEALREWTIANGVDSDHFFKAADKPPADAVVIPEFRPHHK